MQYDHHPLGDNDQDIVNTCAKLCSNMPDAVCVVCSATMGSAGLTDWPAEPSSLAKLVLTLLCAPWNVQRDMPYGIKRRNHGKLEQAFVWQWRWRFCTGTQYDQSHKTDSGHPQILSKRFLQKRIYLVSPHNTRLYYTARSCHQRFFFFSFVVLSVNLSVGLRT